jgi:lipid II:glycine glycyltransferase (peptidoglycan interpeptide bridge formation enzyme)
MQARILSDSDQAQFDKFIAAQSGGSFLQAWQWGEWQKHLGLKVVRFMVDDILAAQAIKIKIPILGKRYFYLPYGPVVNQEKSPQVIQEAMTALINELKKQKKIICIRLEPKIDLPLKNVHAEPSVHIQPGRTLHIDAQQSVEALQTQMHPKTRYNIKVAQRHGVVIESELIPAPQHGLHLKEIVDLLMNTADRQGFKSHPRSYYEEFIDFFAKQIQPGAIGLTIYKAFYQKQLLAAGLMLDFTDTRTYLFGGSSSEHKNVMAPYLMHWQAMQDAAAKGLHYYDFWGVETATGKASGFVRFKQGFGGSELEYPGARDIVLKPLWYTTYALLRMIKRKI